MTVRICPLCKREMDTDLITHVLLDHDEFDIDKALETETVVFEENGKAVLVDFPKFLDLAIIKKLDDLKKYGLDGKSVKIVRLQVHDRILNVEQL